jgi:hypothetical protein
MLAPAAISLLVGAVLGQRFKVLALAPVIALTLLFAVGASLVRHAPAWSSAEIAAVAVVGLQVGYLFGLGFRHLMVLARANRIRASSVSSLTTRHPVH